MSAEHVSGKEIGPHDYLASLEFIAPLSELELSLVQLSVWSPGRSHEAIVEQKNLSRYSNSNEVGLFPKDVLISYITDLGGDIRINIAENFWVATIPQRNVALKAILSRASSFDKNLITEVPFPVRRELPLGAFALLTNWNNLSRPDRLKLIRGL